MIFRADDAQFFFVTTSHKHVGLCERFWQSLPSHGLPGSNFRVADKPGVSGYFRYRYGPILIASLADPSTDVKVEGINYFLDTLLFAGAILALAGATPRTD
jgi:hypothetical protein